MLKLAIIRNNLSYLAFRKALLPFKVFSINDAQKIFPGFHSKRLNEWQHKGYIRKIINKWWLFTEVPAGELLQYRISNLLQHPSYVSLETALSHYQFIPEGVYSTEAVTSVKTVSYTTPVGNYHYRSFKPGYYFGYTIIHLGQVPVLIAEPEKAILDYLYLNSTLNKSVDFDALRFNADTINEKINWEKLTLYTRIFDSVTLNKRVRLFKKIQLHVTNR